MKKTKFTSPNGDAPERITVLNLLQRMELLPDLKMEQMIESLGVDKDELYAILDNVARAIPRDPFQMTCGTLRGILSWGVAIGYFYGRQNPTLKVN